jgi:hypothetical protein
MSSGVPNGSVLRKLGFNIFINDANFCNVVRFSNYLLLADLPFFREINFLHDSLLTHLDIISVRCLVDG